jgi:autotransporter-associated beta strand protein
MPSHRLNTLRSFAVVAVAAFSSSRCAIALPAFPGAEGYGAYAVGGRNGDVYHVTNLNASGAGSFADAISTVPSAGRTIVFDVSGYIRFPSGSNGTRLTSSKVTIAGQTAPGDGIGFYNNFFRISGDDIVIRHVRFRMGKYGSGGDCVDLDSGSLNAILDHVSMQFSTDENMSSFSSPPENLTLQYSLNAWGLESHSCGGLWDQNHATSHHNLWAHNHTRNPKARPGGLLDWVNNVTFDWDIGFIMGDSTSNANWKANVINNYFICPPGNIRSKALEKASLGTNGLPNFTVFVSGNLMDNDGDGLLNGTDKGYGIVSGSSYNQSASAIVGSPAPAVPVTTDNPLTAYKKIVSNAGALRLDVGYSGAVRDEVDTILLGKLTSQTHFHITRESATGASNGGFGTLLSSAAPIDTDRDGMPDYYENALGWSVAADDHATALASSGGIITGTTFFPPGTGAGYTRLEEYLHFLAIPHGVVAKNVSGSPTSLVVDLRKFTSGFSASPTFTVASASGGAVALSGTGNAIATFTPTLNYTGRARFDFTVTDSAGSTWTQTCAIVVSTSGLPRDLKWKGDSTANAWDTGTSNWMRDGAAIAFSNGDFATFDDTGSKSPAVNVASAAASGIVVDASGNYTFSGSGGLSGPLTKRGTGTLTVNNTGANTLTPASIEQGTLALPSGGGLGGGTLTMTGGALTLGISSGTAIALAGDAAVNVTGSQTLSGAISGAGTLSVGITGSNTFTLAGSLSGFGGTFSLGSSSGFFRLNSSSTAFTGSAAATFDLGTGNVTMTNRNGNLTIDIGALRGGVNTTLSGGNNATTYNIGATGADTTFAGAITNAGGATSITKTGPGTLTLTGTSTYTGATNVNAGWLLVGGALGNTAVTVATGAFLGGGGTIGGSLNASAGATLSPATAPFTGGTLTVNGGLTLNGNTLYYDMTSSPAGANDKIQMGAGTLALSGTQYFQFLLLDGALSAGTYNLITGATSSTASNVSLTHNLPTGTRQTFTVKRSAAGSNPSLVWLEVLGDPATLTWTGATSATWDTVTANNFTGATPNTFGANDAVIFDDTSTVNTITIPAALAPRAITFNNATRAYVVGGVDQTVAAITSGALVKNGAGSLTLTGKNTPQSTTIGPGATITFANDNANSGALGTGPITLNGGTISMFSATSGFSSSTMNLVVPAGQSGTINTDARHDIYGTLTGAGTLNLNIPWIRTAFYGDWSTFTGTINIATDGNAESGDSAHSLNGDFRIGPDYSWPGLPAATVNLGARVWFYWTGNLNQGAGTVIEIGELSGTSLSGLMGGPIGGRNFTYRIGGKTLTGSEVTFAGTITEQNSGTASTYVKTGAGTWTLSGTGNWNGGTTVEQGTLKITGSVTCGAATNVAGAAALNLAGGSLSTDALNIASGATFAASGNATLAGDFNNDGTASVTGGTFACTGDVVNNGTMRFNGGAQITATGAFVNNGLLDLLTSPSALPVNFQNNGIVLDRGMVKVASAAKNGANFTVTISSYSAHTYQLTRADSLAGPWDPVGAVQNGAHTVNGDGSITPAPLTFTDSGGATAPQKFYRIIVGP